MLLLLTRHNPSKLPDVDDILDKYRGQGDALFRQLEAKYLPQVSLEAASWDGAPSWQRSLVSAHR